jgi:predicted nucleotidyltransferase
LCYDASVQYPGGWRPVPYRERCRERRERLRDALATAIEACRLRPEVRQLIVFGSYVRDEVSPWSDLDLLVIADGDAAPAVDALHAAGTLGDVLGMTAAAAMERLAATPLGRTILEEGRVAYARSAR